MQACSEPDLVPIPTGVPARGLLFVFLAPFVREIVVKQIKAAEDLLLATTARELGG